jgi:hypothetical protein
MTLEELATAIESVWADQFGEMIARQTARKIAERLLAAGERGD